MRLIALLLICVFVLSSLSCSSWHNVRHHDVETLHDQKPLIRILLKDGSQFTARNYEFVPDTLITYSPGSQPATGQKVRIPLDRIHTIEARQDAPEKPLLYTFGGLMAFLVALGASDAGRED